MCQGVDEEVVVGARSPQLRFRSKQEKSMVSCEPKNSRCQITMQWTTSSQQSSVAMKDTVPSAYGSFIYYGSNEYSAFLTRMKLVEQQAKGIHTAQPLALISRRPARVVKFPNDIADFKEPCPIKRREAHYHAWQPLWEIGGIYL